MPLDAPGPIVVLSLDRTPERMAAFVADNPELACERFPAVDGRRVDRGALEAGGLVDPALAYTPGALGCALSHAELWRRSLEAGATLTVVEDDAVLHPDFAGAMARAAVSEPAAELILWGWNFNSVLAGRLFGETPFAMGFDEGRMRASIPRFRATPPRSTLLRLHRAFGIPCYTITPKGAEALLQRCFPLRPQSVYFPLLDRDVPNTGIDMPMNAAYPHIQAYCAFPPLALTRNAVETSTVEAD